MARITVEDCLKNVDNRFDLVLKAASRAHLLEMGAADPMVPRDNDKPTVIALREIAAGFDVSEEAMSVSNDPKAAFQSTVTSIGHHAVTSDIDEDTQL